jgi:transcriptional regulator with XRE-family HTH domain
VGVALATPEFDQLLLTLAILQKHGGGTQVALAGKMGMKKQQLNQIIKRTNENPTMDLLLKMAAVGPKLTPPIAIELGDLFRPDLIHNRLTVVSQIQTQESVSLRTLGLTGSDRPSSYTPATNVPSEVRGITDVAQIVADISQLQREVSALKKDLGDNTLVLFGAFRALRLRFNSAVPTADQSHEVATSTDRQSTGTSGRTGRPRKHHGKGRG